MAIPTCVLAGEGIRSHTTRGHDPDTYAEMGSLTKVVTGTILMQLAHAGELSIDRPLGDPAPSWQQTASLTGHNSATRASSVFAGALPDGRWLLMHRLHGSVAKTNQAAIEWFKTRGHKEARRPPAGETGRAVRG